MPRTAGSRRDDLVVLLLGAALPVTALVVLRALPPAPLTPAGLGWVVPMLAGLLVVAASSLTVTALVAGIRDGGVAALAGGMAAAGVAGGGLVWVLAGSRDGLVPAVAMASILAVVAAAADRGDTVVAGWPSRLAVAGGGLAVAGGAVIAGSLLLGLAAATPAIPAVMAVSTILAGSATLVARARWLSVAAAGLAIGALGLALDRGDGAEGAIGILALVSAALAGLRAARRSAVGPADATSPFALPPLAQALADAVLSFDGALGLRDWNGRAATLLGLDGGHRGTRLEDLLGVEIGSLPVDDGTRTIAGLGGLEITLHRAGAGVIAVLREQPQEGDGDRLGRELRGTIEELLQARRTVELQRAEIERTAAVDRLTGVASRGAIIDRLRTEIAQARRYQHPVAVVLLDIDRFGDVNARHGVRGGDALLREVALRMRLRVREADALGRAGSDGFLAILPHTDEAGAATFADALRRRLGQRPVPIGDEAVEVTASVGVAVLRPGEELDLDGLLARVSEALESARSAGGDRIALDRTHGLARLEDHRPHDGSSAADSTT